MKKYVVTIREDICAQNGKDVNATVWLEKTKLYGTVEDYDTNMVAVKAEFNSVLSEVNARYEAIKNQNLTQDEISFLNLYRKLKSEIVSVHVAEKETLKKQLADIKAENEGRIAKIAAILASASVEVSK